MVESAGGPDAARLDVKPLVSYRYIEPSPAESLGSLFDDGLAPVVRGDVLPPLWHWATLPGWAPASSRGVDGHPRTGGFLPDLGKPRRMFAGGRVELHTPLHVDERVRLVDRVVSAVPKSGRQGDFVLVEVESLVFNQEGQLALTERRDLVYRDAVAPSETPARPSAEPRPIHAPIGPLLTAAGNSWTFRTDPTLLMRFSSATSNGHRIHYDEPYARVVEGYPGLVVHGPLMTLAMAEILRLEGIDQVRAISHRNVRALYCGDEACITVVARDASTYEVALKCGEDVHAVLTAEV